MTTGEPILSGISFSILTIKPKIMLFVSTIAVALLLAVSAKAETKTATKVLTSTEKALAAVQANDQVQMKMTKSREQMIAKYADVFKNKKYTAVTPGSMETMTTVPYTTTGFIYQNSYFGDGATADSTCSSISQVIGYEVNYCIVDNNVAFKFQLTGNSCSGGIVQYFGDEACTIMLGTSSLEPYMDMCEIDESNTDYTYPVYMSWRCSSSATPVTPAGAINALAFPRNSCSGTSFGYYSFPVNVCLPQGGEDGLMMKYFCDGAVPTVGIWIDPTCAGEVAASQALPDTCSADASDDDEYTDDATDDDDYVPPFIQVPPTVSQTNFPTSSAPVEFASQLFCPVMAPTLKPAFAPTMFPTAATATAVSLTLTQKVYGISAGKFNANLAYTTAFITTIASTMTGITPANIINLQISGSSRRRLTGRALATADESLSATYTISATTTSSSDSLYYQLNSAVTSGSFNTALTQYASLYGANDLEGCTSNSVAAPSSSSNGLSAGAIAGIVIGCVAGVAIIAGIIFFLACGMKKPPMAQAQPASEMNNKA